MNGATRNCINFGPSSYYVITRAQSKRGTEITESEEVNYQNQTRSERVKILGGDWTGTGNDARRSRILLLYAHRHKDLRFQVLLQNTLTIVRFALICSTASAPCQWSYHWLGLQLQSFNQQKTGARFGFFKLKVILPTDCDFYLNVSDFFSCNPSPKSVYPMSLKTDKSLH